jgi:hypothetical protein
MPLIKISCGFRDHALASHKSDYSREVSHRSTALIPHLEGEVGGKRMDLVKVEEERLEDGRRRICEVTTLLEYLRESY